MKEYKGYKIINVIWYSPGSTIVNIGIVICESIESGERRAWIGTGQKYDEDTDIKSVMDWGAKFRIGDVKRILNNLQGSDVIVSSSLPTIDEAGAIAVSVSEDLTAQEQSFFIAGFQEYIKYLAQLKDKTANG